MAEGAALDVLAGEADADSVRQDRRQRQLLGQRPVDGALARLVQRGVALLAHALELPVHREIGRQRQQRPVQGAQLVERHAGLDARRGAGRRRLGLRLDEVLFGLQGVERRLELAGVLLVQRFDRVLGHVATLDQGARPDLADRRVRGDRGIHQWLRERGFIPFVVPVPAVADQIDQKIALELRAVGNRQTRHLDARFRVVGVDVDDRDLESAREAAGIRRAVGVLRPGREAQLVVRDDVNRAAGAVAGQPAQIQGLGDNPLTGERGVAVNQDRHAAGRIEPRRPGAVHRGAGGAGHPLDHRIDRFEVTRVRRHRHHQIHGASAFDRAMRPGVIFHVAGPGHVFPEPLRGHWILELGEDLRVRLVQHVGHHVQTAAVRHANQNRGDSGLGRFGDHLVEDRDHDVHALDREPRLAGERPVQEPLERFDLGESIEQRPRIDRIRRGAEPPALRGVTEPSSLLRYEHVRVVVSRGRTVQPPERLDHIEHGGGAVAEWRGDQAGRQPAQVLDGDAVVLG
jgi:hypothetical protein